MRTKCDPTLLVRSRDLRNNSTKQEKHLWYDFLNHYPVRFMRQKPIGFYIADFYCASAKLVIELDGSQHYSESGLAYDEKRTSDLEKAGMMVLRFTNTEIDQQFEGVCKKIDDVVKKRMEKK